MSLRVNEAEYFINTQTLKNLNEKIKKKQFAHLKIILAELSRPNSPIKTSAESRKFFSMHLQKLVHNKQFSELRMSIMTKWTQIYGLDRIYLEKKLESLEILPNEKLANSSEISQIDTNDQIGLIHVTINCENDEVVRIPLLFLLNNSHYNSLIGTKRNAKKDYTLDHKNFSKKVVMAFASYLMNSHSRSMLELSLLEWLSLWDLANINEEVALQNMCKENLSKFAMNITTIPQLKNLIEILNIHESLQRLSAKSIKTLHFILQHMAFKSYLKSMNIEIICKEHEEKFYLPFKGILQLNMKGRMGRMLRKHVASVVINNQKNEFIRLIFSSCLLKSNNLRHIKRIESKYNVKNAILICNFIKMCPRIRVVNWIFKTSIEFSNCLDLAKDLREDRVNRSQSTITKVEGSSFEVNLVCNKSRLTAIFVTKDIFMKMKKAPANVHFGTLAESTKFQMSDALNVNHVLKKFKKMNFFKHFTLKLASTGDSIVLCKAAEKTNDDALDS